MKLIDTSTIFSDGEIRLNALDGFETYAEGNCIYIRPKWIKCTPSSMPSTNTEVIAYFPTYTDRRGDFFHVSYLGFNGSNESSDWMVLADTYGNSSNYDDFEPTHWMPLLEVPHE